MEDFEGQFPTRSAVDVFRELGLERRTGILDFREGEAGKEDRFFFVSGDLYLAPEHPLALALASGEGIEADDRSTGDDGQPSEMWLTQCTFRLKGWTEGSFRFAENLAAIPSDLVGPLPTFSIIMSTAVADRDEFDLLRSLGGEQARFVATPGSQAPPPGAVQLDPQEAFFLSRLDHAASVKDLLAQSELGPFEGVQRLCRLLAAGLICREEDLPEARSGTLLSPAILEKFSSRIQETLERQPLELEPEDHRKQIAGLLGRLGGLTYYELLGIGLGATSEEIHDAFSQLARVVHPSNAEALGLAGKEGGMQLLLEKATEAYLTLSDRDRSRRYLREIGSPGELQGGQNPELRRDEVERLAEENYKRARAFVLREDFHFAVELLQQAVRVDPKPEYYLLLGRCQARNPRWLPKAIASYGRALQLDNGNLDIRFELAGALEAAGELPKARREYREILRRQPNHRDAGAGLARLEGQAKKPMEQEGSWLTNLLERLPGRGR